MRRLKEIPVRSDTARSETKLHLAGVDTLVSELETNGIVILSGLLNARQLRGMQQAFAARLSHMRWNNFDGYSKTEPYREMIEDVLMLDQGFVDLALHPLVKQILNGYMGSNYALTEAKGWRSLPTKRNFHGWHGDSWYDQAVAKEIHREIKVAMYLTEVRSGAFNYVAGSHRRHHPYDLKRSEVRDLDRSRIIEAKGAAGTIFMFDSSGIHRQAHPVLEPRQAVFYAYHDPTIPLRAEDVDAYRYHPLLLNAAFLGNLDEEDRRILGFGNKVNYQPAFQRNDRPPLSYHAMCVCNDLRIRLGQAKERNLNRAKFVFRKLLRK